MTDSLSSDVAVRLPDDPAARRALLFDIYGGLLTPLQQRVFALRYEHDLSLAEIAAEVRASRQAVFDMLQRSERALEQAETRLKVAERYLQQRGALEAALAQAGALARLAEQDGVATGIREGIRRLVVALARLQEQL